MGIAESSRQKNRNWAGASVRGRSRELVDLRRWSDDLTRIVSDWLWETNAEHRFVRVSDRAAEVIGYHPREMSGRKLVDFLHPSDGGVLLSRLAGRLPFRNVPCEMVARGGRRRSLSVSGVPLFCLETGNFQGFRGVAQDITDRSMVEDALRRRDAILRAVSHAACVLLAGSDWSTEMPGLLARLGHAAECDQVHLFETQSSPVDGPALLPKFHWIRPGTTGRCCKGGLRPTPVGEMGLAQRHPRLASGETVFVLVESIAHGWRRMLQAEGIRSMLFVPLFAGRTWWGVLRFDKSAVAADWGEPEVEAVKAAAGIVSAAIGRQQDQETIRTSETRFRVAFHTSPDAMAIVRLSDGLVVEANDNCSRLSGLDHEALIGHSLAQLPLFDNARAVARMLREISKRGEITGAETVFRHSSGRTWVGSVSAKTVVLAGEPCVLAAVRDVTSRHQADETIRKLSLAVEQSPALVMITNTEGIIEYVNPKFTQVTGYLREEVIGRTPELLKSEQTPEEEYERIWESLKNGREWRGEIFNRRKNGEYFWAAEHISPIRGHDGRITHFLSLIEDITAYRSYEERLRYQARHDALTALPNRSLFFDQLASAIERARGDGQRIAVLIVDLDTFKLFNDTFGPDVGDAVLRQVARRLSVIGGSAGMVARLAGDEFGLVAFGIADAAEVKALAQRILAGLAAPFEISGHQIYVHASIGIALFPDHGDDEVGVANNATKALAKAKKLGGNAQLMFCPSVEPKTANRMTLAQDLRRAVSRNEFELRYQPIVDVSAMRIVASEALLRWRHPQLGLIRPDTFVPLAEETGLIEPLGEWVLEQACRQTKAWHDAGFAPLGIAVNVSTRQLERGRVDQMVESALRQSGLAPESLCLEITESAFLANVDDPALMLRRLHSLGVSISVDDFGTGYCSFNYLRRLPLTALKIDRSFIRDITASADAAAIADAILAIGQRMNLKIVAEGVERPQQQNYLRQRGCILMQGFLFSQPIKAEAYTTLLKSALAIGDAA